MKFIFQIALLSLLVFIGFLFYENYFVNKEIELVEEPKINIEKDKPEDSQNVIKNLTYNVKIENNGNYEVTSNSSEVIIKDGYEIILMKNVTAIFEDNNNKKLYINSDIAEFNSRNYNTKFKDNIKIKYENNLITSNNLDFDFVNNNILVYNKVVYIGLEGKIQTDNIKIDLISKNIDIYMNNKNNNIKAKLF